MGYKCSGHPNPNPTRSQFHRVCSKANIQSEDPPDQFLLFVSDHFTQKREENSFPLSHSFTIHWQPKWGILEEQGREGNNPIKLCLWIMRTFICFILFPRYHLSEVKMRHKKHFWGEDAIRIEQTILPTLREKKKFPFPGEDYCLLPLLPTGTHKLLSSSGNTHSLLETRHTYFLLERKSKISAAFNKE